VPLLTETVYKKLFYDKVDFNTLADGINPNFKCPICRHTWMPKLDLGTSFQATFDYNQKATFAIPQHINAITGKQCDASNQTIELFVAVHKDSKGTQLCLQRSDAEGAAGLNSNWMRR
jgi:hypothetical protein